MFTFRTCTLPPQTRRYCCNIDVMLWNGYCYAINHQHQVYNCDCLVWFDLRRNFFYIVYRTDKDLPLLLSLRIMEFYIPHILGLCIYICGSSVRTQQNHTSSILDGWMNECNECFSEQEPSKNP